MPNDPKREPEKILPKYELLEDIAKRVIDNISKRTGKPEIETGIKLIDDGFIGLHRSHLTIIAARPSIGKTSLATQIAWNVSREVKVAFVSLEMTKESIMERLFIQSQKLNGLEIMLGNNPTKYLNSASRWFTEMDLRRGKLKLFDSYCYTERQLYTLIEYLEYYPDVLILDHIQCIRPDSKIKVFEAIGNYLSYLNEISKKHNISVVCLSQINRAGEDDPGMSNLKGSGSIEEYADEVVVMNSIKPDEFGNNLLTKIAKNRYGARDVYFPMYFHGESFRFFNSKDEFNRTF